MNVKNELLKIIAENGHKIEDIYCAVLSVHFDYKDEYQLRCFLKDNVSWLFKDDNMKYLILKEGYSQEQLKTFINETDVEYNDGFGGQELYGYVMFSDNSWLERNEYDGSEWWEFKKFFIPEQCKEEKV